MADQIADVPIEEATQFDRICLHIAPFAESAASSSGVVTASSWLLDVIVKLKSVLLNSERPMRFCCSLTRRRTSIARRTAHAMSSSGIGIVGSGESSFRSPLTVRLTAQV